MHVFEPCRLSQPSSGTMIGRKELRTDFETKIAITFYLFIVQKNFLYHWNLRVIMRLMNVLVFQNLYLELN